MRNPLTHRRKSLPMALPTGPNSFLTMPAAFDELIEDFYQEAFNLATSPWGAWEKLMICPLVDVLEDDKEFKIEAEMPGMGPEDIKLSIEDNKLTIKGEKAISTRDQERNYTKREIAYGTYHRTIALPSSVDATHIKASFKKGMLWVTLPKKTGGSEQFREIEIEQM